MTTNTWPYPYRVRKSNSRGISCALTHFRKLERAQAHVAEFFSPASSESCAPRRGYPFDTTVAYIEQRVSWETWRVIGTYTSSPVLAD